MKNRKLLLIVSLVLALTMSLGGTLAYLTDTDEAVNVMTLGNVDIELKEYQRVVGDDGKWVSTGETDKYGYTPDKLEPYVQGQPLYPAYFADGKIKWDDRNGSSAENGTGHQQSWAQVGASGSNQLFDDSVKGVQDKFVFVENTGTSDAYVRVWFAFEQGDIAEQDFMDKVVQFNTNEDHWKWEEENWKYGVEIEGTKYVVASAVYSGPKSNPTGILAAGTTSYPSLLQLYMKPTATNEHIASLGSTYEVLTFVQAVQTNNFENATQALTAAFGDNHPWQGDVNGVPVPVVNDTAALQAAIDAATTNTTIMLEPGVQYDTVYVRPTATNNTTMCCQTHNYTTTDAAAFKEHLADGQWHTTPRYTTTLDNLTIVGAKGATIAGVTVTSGHIYGDVYDYVLGKDYDVGSAYYNTLYLNDITFKDVEFTGKVDINTSDANSVYDGVTFDGCTFTTGGTASANGAALRYYNEANNGKVKNIVVKNCTFKNCYQGVYVHHVNGVTVTGCTFDTTGHNAIALQSGSEAVNLKYVVITGNTFKNINDRVIRFNLVGADSNITIKNNTATNSGDEDGEVMKATSIADGVVTDISNNNWGSGTVATEALQDKVTTE